MIRLHRYGEVTMANDILTLSGEANGRSYLDRVEIHRDQVRAGYYSRWQKTFSISAKIGAFDRGRASVVVAINFDLSDLPPELCEWFDMSNGKKGIVGSVKFLPNKGS